MGVNLPLPLMEN